MRTHLRTLSLIMALSPAPSVAATFQVTTTADSGADSLREAILGANSNPGLDLIRFAIPSGPFTISPVTPLPSVTSPVDMDGKNFGSGPRIEIAGGSAGQGANGLRVTAGSSLLVSLVVRDFQAAAFGGGGIGIVLENGGGNFLEDSVCQGNAGGGLLILNSSNNRIGSSTPGGTRNVFSQNGSGIRVEGTSNNNVIVGNRIGTDISGTVAQGNLGDGIAISGGQGNDVAGASTHPSFENLISANGANGISISGSASLTLVHGNKIGTDAFGMVDLGNGFNGIEIAGSANNRIGPLFPGQQGNLISGNDAHGVRIGNGASGTIVQGNFIGTNAPGALSLGNAFNAVLLDGASGNTIGAAMPAGERNILAGNGTRGVRLTNGASQNIVTGNWIGLSANDTPLPNVVAGVGLDNAATNNTIGGTTTGAGNFISGNGGSGIFITDATVSGNAILGNTIGMTPAGAAAGNAVHGVHVAGSASGNTIGTPGGGNTIAFNSGDGVFVESGTGIPVRANRMVGNGGLGIDLAPDGVTSNDPGDSDSGPNALQNFPVLTLARSPGSTTVVQGSLASAPSTLYKVDFFWSSSCDPLGQGEGENYLGTADVTTDGAGNASFTATLSTPSPLGSVITATATDPGGNTSELSNCALVGARFYTLTPCRVADTRDPIGPYGGPAFSNGTERSFFLTNRCGIPATARAVSVNLTVTQPGGQGHMTLYPSNSPVPSTSTINYSAGQTRANNAVVTLGSAGDLTVRCVQTSSTVHAILDVNGYFE